MNTSMNNVLKALLVSGIVVLLAVVGILFLGPQGPRVEPPPEVGRAAVEPDEKGPEPVDTLPGLPPPSPRGTVEVTVEVVDSSERFLAEAEVSVRRAAGGITQVSSRPVAEQRTDSEGICVFRLEPDRYAFRAYLRTYRPQEVDRTLASGQAAIRLRIQLTKGNTISGRVTDLTGNPIPGANVRAFRNIGRKGESLEEQIIRIMDLEKITQEPLHEAITDSDGRYVVDGLAKSEYTVRVTAARFTPAEKDNIPTGSTDVDFQLGPGSSFGGWVVTAGGQGIEGARVQAYDGSEMDNLIKLIERNFQPPIADAGTDAEGRFDFHDLGAGVYRLLVGADRHQERLVEKVVVGAGRNPDLKIVLERGLCLSGVVMAPDGTPLQGATVRLRGGAPVNQKPGQGLTDEFIFTDAEGRFVFDTLEDYRYDILADHPDYATQRVARLTPVSEVKFDIQVHLEEGGAIAGRVTDWHTGAAVPAAMIQVDGLMGVMKQATTDANGDYVLRGIPGSRSRKRNITVSAEGYARVTNEPVDVRDGSLTPNVDFRLIRTCQVSGFVVSSAGTPVPDAWILIQREKERTGGGMPRTLGSTNTGQDGVFVIDDVEPGEGNTVLARSRHYLEARSEPFDIVPGQDRVEGVKVILEVGASVVGRVVNEHGEPVSGVSVRVEREGDTGAILPRSAMTGEDGSFRIEGLASGAAVLHAEHPGFRPQKMPVALVEGDTVAGVVIQVTQGGQVAGVVTDTENRPLKGARVTVTDSSDGGVRKVSNQSDSRGAFTVSNLGGDAVEILVEMPGYEAEERKGISVNTTDNNFALRRTGAIRGFVVDLQGNPVSSFTVRPRSVGGASGSRLRSKSFTAKDGSFEYNDVPGGVYEVIVTAAGFAGATVPDVEVRSGEVIDLGMVEVKGIGRG